MQICMWVLVCVGYVCIVGSRFHYSDDVLIGLLLCLFVFKQYHMYIQTAHQRSNPWNWFLCWFEQKGEDIQQMHERERARLLNGGSDGDDEEERAMLDGETTYKNHNNNNIKETDGLLQEV